MVSLKNQKSYARRKVVRSHGHNAISLDSVFFPLFPSFPFYQGILSVRVKSQTQKICENLSKLKGEKALPSGICYLVTQSTMYIMGKQERTFQF